MTRSPDGLRERVILASDYLPEWIDNEYTVYRPALTVSLSLNETGGLICLI